MGNPVDSLFSNDHRGWRFHSWSVICLDSSFLTVQRNECVSVYVSPVIDCRSNQAVWWTAFISKKVISYSNKSYFIYLSSFSLCRSWGSEVLNSQCMNLDWGCTQNMWKVLVAKEKREFITPARQPRAELCSISFPSSGHAPQKREAALGSQFLS